MEYPTLQKMHGKYFKIILNSVVGRRKYRSYQVQSVNWKQKCCCKTKRAEPQALCSLCGDSTPRLKKASSGYTRHLERQRKALSPRHQFYQVEERKPYVLLSTESVLNNFKSRKSHWREVREPCIALTSRTGVKETFWI